MRLLLDKKSVTTYSYIMTKREKLRARARNNPKDVTFEEFQPLLRQAGWTFDHQRGSHQVWYSPNRLRLPVQEGKNGKAKGYQVEQFFEALKEDSNGET
ncbi:MAG: type II toxin-antitoxin system HicA family toxin [Desulfohalobiaceae bacterium]|nr:type II toxin-antitoxin system HicA family toxin [Desulfohalobiaceae bacterium]